jgi:hypothetical protein
MIDYQQARQIAADWLSAHPARGRDGVLELCILDEHTIEVDFGWVFSYTSRLYQETGEFQYAVPRECTLHG